MSRDQDRRAYARELAAEALHEGDAVGWFERLYADAAVGRAVVPWADEEVNPHLRSWVLKGNLPRTARRALVVGCGLGDDAEFLASSGLDVTAFDAAPTAIEQATRRFPDSAVRYAVADVLEPPSDWARAFDLVVEIYTVQVLRGEARATAIERIAELPARGGTLLVVARARHQGDPPGDLPWPLTREEIEAFAVDDLELVRLEDFLDEEGTPRWRAAFTRGTSSSS